MGASRSALPISVFISLCALVEGTPSASSWSPVALALSLLLRPAQPSPGLQLARSGPAVSDTAVPPQEKSASEDRRTIGQQLGQQRRSRGGHCLGFFVRSVCIAPFLPLSKCTPIRRGASACSSAPLPRLVTPRAQVRNRSPRIAPSQSNGHT
jgi:hypothetical protein